MMGPRFFLEYQNSAIRPSPSNVAPKMADLTRFLLAVLVLGSTAACETTRGENSATESAATEAAAAESEVAESEVAESAAAESSIEEELPPGVEQLLPRGRIAAVFEPEFVSAGEAEIADDAWVLGVVVNGSARAYSLNLLNKHEIVNDKIGNSAFAAVW